MYPFFRLARTLIRGVLSKRISPEAECETTFRCLPWDIDVFMEMNNGRILTLYDLGRFDLVVRSGLMSQLRQKKWGLVVAGSTIQYRKRIRVFDKVTIRTKVAGFEGRWIYVSQSMWVRGRPTSSVLLRTAITSKGSTVGVNEVSEALNIQPWKHGTNDWMQSWIESETKRPWPPE